MSLWTNCIEMLPDEQASLQQIAILREMTGQQRLRLAERLYWPARKMKTAGLRSQHPERPKEKINAEVRRIFLHARS
jgi:phytoene/squalene synthetase